MASEFNEINDPKSWEMYFKSLLKYHYGQENVFDIPDQNEGDWGVECYTSCGKVFQCYFPDKNHSVSKLYENQRNKINTDLKKLTVTNAGIWKKTFDNQSIKIKSWVLATPLYNNKLLAQYIAKKTKEIRSLGLDFIDDDFRVSVQTADDYPIEQKNLANCFTQLKIDINEITDEYLVEWIGEKVGFLADLHPKLVILADGDEKAIDNQKLAISNFYLTYQNMLDVLERDFPQIHLTVIDCVNARKQKLKQRISLFSIGKAPSTILEDNIQQLENDLERVMPNFFGGTRSDMCAGVIAGWLIECPLRF